MIDLASLVVAPTAVKDGKVYNAIPNDQDFTFSRGTEATRVNSAGLIEKARTNLLLQSNTFDTTWTNVNTSETSGQSGYDGSNDAWLITLTGGTATKLITQSTSTLSGVYTASFYAKAGTHSIVQIGTSTQSNIFVCFDLSDGSVGSLSANAINAKATSISNGWYRIEVAFLGTNANGISIAGVDSISATRFQSTSSTGNFYIQDSQLEQGLVSTDVITTTTSSVTVGITDDLPRVDYSGGGCPSLLLEGSRTNLFEHSEYFGTSNWTKQNVTLNTNDAQSPEGVQNASKIYPSSSGNGRYIYNPTSGASSIYTISAYVKADGKNVAYLYIDGFASVGVVYFDLSDQSIQEVDGSSNTVTGKIESVGNGWYRISATIGTAQSISSSSGLGVSDAKGSLSVTKSGEDGILVYGVQIEAGSYSTSYIPTYGTSTSRSADSLTSATLSLNLGYTAMIEMETLSTSDYNQIQFRQDTPSIVYALRIGNQVNVGGSTYVANNTTGQNKFALAVDTDGTYALYKNGTSISTGSGITANLQKIRTDSSGQRIKQIILFPTRLTNDQLAELTK